MVLRIADPFWRDGARGIVLDEHDRPVYRLHGSALEWGESLRLFDDDDRDLLRIDQVLLDAGPCFQIHHDGALRAELHRGDGWRRRRGALPVPAGAGLVLEGSFWQHEYRLHDGDQPLARVSKNYWGWSDSYGVGLEAQAVDRAPLIVGLCLVVDMLLADGAEAGDG